MSAFTIFIQHSIGTFSHSDQTSKINKRHPNRKEGSKTVTIHRQHNIVHRKPYRLLQKTTQPIKISEFDKVVGYKLNIQKLMAFLYTNNEVLERETRGKITFTIMTRKLKYLDKFNQGGKRSVLRKLHNSGEIN